MSNNLYPELRLVFGFAEGCHWCDRFKEQTLPMIKALKIRYQILTEEKHLLAYKADDYGYPLIVICRADGNPLKYHGGFLTLAELMKKIDKIYDKYYPNGNKNPNR